jgi:hypothetical protein
MSMAGRIAVAAGIVGTTVIVGGIVGVVSITDIGARADNAGSRVSVAKIDVAAPAHVTPFPVMSTDSDIPAPAVPETVTVPAPEPGKVVATEARAPKSPAATSDAASKGSGSASHSSGHNSSGQTSSDRNGDQGTKNGNAGDQGNQGANTRSGAPERSRLNAPLQPRLVQREAIIAQAPVHGNGHDSGRGRGHHKTSHTQSRESSPAHPD